MSLRSGRDKAISAKTLLCLIQALEGRTTTVELLNEVSVEGTISEVDGRMNIQMVDATVTLIGGCHRTFPYFFVRGRNVRYVHIPADINIMATIEDRVKRAQRIVPANQQRNELQVLITRRKREQFRRQAAGRGRGRGRGQARS